ncbi:MAG: divalent metal cation transporter [Allgaiera sp.]|jgi:Mn2+/Fe2+ NRAMP family transporter|nr:divalent metal cation transporter [Allgaiera sp.]
MPSASLKSRLLPFLAVAGPGLVVMLADTDAGSVITAAQSGAQWGYKLLALQLILIPILYVVQELTVRLGLFTARGHGELIREHFGARWAWLSVATLLVSCLGALITELSGIAGVGALYGIPLPVSVGITLAFLMVVVITGSYRSVERVAVAIGLFELAFLYVAVVARPDPIEMLRGLASVPLGDRSYLYLVAANIGAVIMPWMVFYQQSAVVDKGLKPINLKAARDDTALGAVVTQAIMAAVLISAAATFGRAGGQGALDTVQEIARALTPYLGEVNGRLLFALGMLGAALVATIVVALTAAWGLGEVMGYNRSLEHHPREAPWFYLVFTVVLVAGGILVSSGINLVELSVGVEVMNALLLPIVLGFLYTLSRRALPEAMRLKGPYAVVVAVTITLTAGLGVYGGISGLLGP